MLYKVALYPTEEGFSVSVPELPGCWSQGETEEEALRNIEDAMRDYLVVASELARDAQAREVEVSV
jgi:predicted RNase H-like HicB family nuclease